MEIPSLPSDRLLLRAYRPDEFDFYASMVGSEEVMRYIAPAQDRDAAFRAFCALFGHWQVRGHGMWAVEESSSGTLIGHAGLPHWHGSAGMEVGFAFQPSAWGQGYATEAAKRVLQYAHEAMGARGVLSVIHPENTRSMRVADRMGATHQRDHFAKGDRLLVYVHPDPI